MVDIMWSLVKERYIGVGLDGDYSQKPFESTNGGSLVATTRATLYIK